MKIYYYKGLLAAFFLTLYAFIAMPTNFWHSHKTVGSSSYNIKENKSLLIIKADLNNKSCSTCLHHYTVYNDDKAIVSFECKLPIYSFNEYYFLKNIFSAVYCSINKGPPIV